MKLIGACYGAQNNIDVRLSSAEVELLARATTFTGLKSEPNPMHEGMTELTIELRSLLDLMLRNVL